MKKAIAIVFATVGFLFAQSNSTPTNLKRELNLQVTQSMEQDAACDAWTGTSGPYTLTNAPNPPKSLHLYHNGLRLKQGLDYNLSGNTVTWAQDMPAAADLFVCDYQY